VRPWNLTSHDPEGLHQRSDEQIRRALTHGIGDESIAIYPILPFPEYSLLTKKDVDSFIQYLRGGGKTYTFIRGTSANTSTNLTPDATGLGGWSVDDLVTTMKTNKDKATGAALCRTHPGGPERLGGMADDDLRDIAVYIHSRCHTLERRRREAAPPRATARVDDRHDRPRCLEVPGRHEGVQGIPVRRQARRDTHAVEAGRRQMGRGDLHLGRQRDGGDPQHLEEASAARHGLRDPDREGLRQAPPRRVGHAPRGRGGGTRAAGRKGSHAGSR